MAYIESLINKKERKKKRKEKTTTMTTTMMMINKSKPTGGAVFLLGVQLVVDVVCSNRVVGLIHGQEHGGTADFVHEIPIAVDVVLAVQRAHRSVAASGIAARRLLPSSEVYTGLQI